MGRSKVRYLTLFVSLTFSAASDSYLLFESISEFSLEQEFHLEYRKLPQHRCYDFVQASREAVVMSPGEKGAAKSSASPGDKCKDEAEKNQPEVQAVETVQKIPTGNGDDDPDPHKRIVSYDRKAPEDRVAKFTPDVVHESERLIFRKVTLQDSLFIYELYTDPTTRRLMGNMEIYSQKDAESFIDIRIIPCYRIYGEGYGYYLALDRGSNTPVGLVVIHKEQGTDKKEAELTIIIHPNYRRRGYAKEAATAGLNYCSQIVQLERVYIRVMKQNEAIIRILNSLGFSLTEEIVEMFGSVAMPVLRFEKYL